MTSLKLINKNLSCKILLALFCANSLIAQTQVAEPKIAEQTLQEKKSALIINRDQILHEIKTIISLEEKNSKFRTLGYATVALGAGYYLYQKDVVSTCKDLYSKIGKPRKAAKDELIDLVNLIEADRKVHVDAEQKKSEIRELLDSLDEIGREKPKQSKNINLLRTLICFLKQLSPSELNALLINWQNKTHIEPERGYISSFFHGIWGIGTGIGFQLALGAAIAWTSRSFYKHFMPLSYEYFITHHTNFESALEMVNACTIVGTEKSGDELYAQLSRENLNMAYAQLLKEGHRVIAYMLYATKVKNKDMPAAARSGLDSLAENFKNNLADISDLIASHNLAAIKNRLAAMNNVSKMFVDFEANLAENNSWF